MEATMSLDDKLAAINKAIAEADGDPVKEAQNLQAIVDPQDALNCEGCQ